MMVLLKSSIFFNHFNRFKSKNLNSTFYGRKKSDSYIFCNRYLLSENLLQRATIKNKDGDRNRDRAILHSCLPRPRKRDPIFSFPHTFLPTSAHVGGRHPPSQREILDPCDKSNKFKNTKFCRSCPYRLPDGQRVFPYGTGYGLKKCSSNDVYFYQSK